MLTDCPDLPVPGSTKHVKQGVVKGSEVDVVGVEITDFDRHCQVVYFNYYLNF